MECNECTRTDIKCCVTCGRNSWKCNVLHDCGKDCPEYKKQTNADRIRTMDDFELAGFLETVMDCYECPIEQRCGTFLREDCGKKLLNWLQEEVEET